MKTYRPWGYYEIISQSNNSLTKLITVNSMQKLSLQSHNYRSEHWIVVEGNATVILEDKKYKLEIGKHIEIPVKAKHSLENMEKQELKIIEVQIGSILSEDDIIRYKDIYGRI